MLPNLRFAKLLMRQWSIMLLVIASLALSDPALLDLMRQLRFSARAVVVSGASCTLLCLPHLRQGELQSLIERSGVCVF